MAGNTQRNTQRKGHRLMGLMGLMEPAAQRNSYATHTGVRSQSRTPNLERDGTRLGSHDPSIHQDCLLAPRTDHPQLDPRQLTRARFASELGPGTRNLDPQIP